MRGGHAHEESALAAITLLIVFAVIDLFVDIADDHPAKIIGYFGLWFVLYGIIRYLRHKKYL